MTDISGVQDESRRHWQRVDLVNRGLQRTYHVGVCGFVETHMAIADLNETEFPLEIMATHSGNASQAEGAQHSALITQKAPVPAHAMHFKKPRRSIPSSLCSSSSCSFISPFISVSSFGSFRGAPRIHVMIANRQAAHLFPAQVSQGQK